MLIGSVVLVVILTLIELALPYFSKIAIDRYIVPPTGNSDTAVGRQREAGERRYFNVALSTAAIRSIVAEHADLFVINGRQASIVYKDLDQLSRKEIAVLRQDDIQGLGWVVLVFLALVTAEFGLTFLQRIIMERAGHTIMHDLRLRLYDHIQHQGMAFFARRPVARLVTRMTNDVQNMHELFTTFVSMVFKDVFLLTGISIVLLVLDWQLTLVAFAVLPIVVWLAVGFSVRARDVFRALRVKVAEINTHMAESIEGVKTIQCFVQEDRNYERFEHLNEENYRLGMREIHVFAIFMPMIEVLGIVSVAVLILFGGRQVLGGDISLGILVLAISYIRMFFRPMRDLAENYNVLQNAMASAERIFGLMDIDERLPQAAVSEATAQFTPLVLKQLEVDHVSFAYSPGEWILREVSFVVEQGQTVALVGPTGAGKTSVLNLIQRFYDPTAGQIRINGRGLRRIDPVRLAGLTALVTQEPVLFSATVRQNIFPDPQAVDSAAVARIIASAHCEELVARLPQGLDTLLEKGGAGLSSGERQLITIARALARDAQLILLDEATSYIDSQTEAAIYSALGNLIAGRTCIIVAHRLSTARMADRIVVLHEGRILEEGSHDQLMNAGGFYAQLHRQDELATT
jgi:ATP-binding cassette subfamily B multidrug efflux pump